MQPFTILGATGRTGGQVANLLLAHGHAVRVVLRSAEQATAWTQRGAGVALAAVEDEPRLAAALRDSAGVFAILPDDATVPDLGAHRMRMLSSLAGAVRTAQVPHVVFLSSVLAPVQAGLARDLHAAEQALALACDRVTIVRSAFFQDNVLAQVPAALARGVYADLLPDIAVPMVATADVARVVVDALRAPPPPDELEAAALIEVSGPRYRAAEIAMFLGDAVGKRLAVMPVPAAERAAFLGQIGLPDGFARALAEMYAAIGLPRSTDPTARLVTGATTLAQTLGGARTPVADCTTVAGVIEALTDAWNRHDLVAMGELYRADADFVNIFGGYLASRDEIVREHAMRHAAMFAHARMTHGAPHIRMLASGHAIARVAWTMQGITGFDGAPAADRRGLMLHVLEHAAGRWWIVTSQNTELSVHAPPRFLDLPTAAPVAAVR